MKQRGSYGLCNPYGSCSSCNPGNPGNPGNSYNSYNSYNNNYNNSSSHGSTTDKSWSMKQDKDKTDKTIICANCGGAGHIYRVCNYPICSFGIICCRVTFDTSRNMLVPEYLMVQRKDSLCYVEFIRAKWNPQNRLYIMKLFSSMTPVERERIRSAASFDVLWYGFWHNDACKSFMKEYNQAKAQFDLLKKGFPMRLALSCERSASGGEVITFSLDYVLKNTVAEHAESEWGWPKGRRNINESDLKCALREFSEESGMAARDVSVLTYLKPFEEVFNGCNQVRYRHVYYVAVQAGASISANGATGSIGTANATLTAMQAQEIRQVAWCSYDDVMKNTREINVERRELFKRVHQLVQSNLFNIMLIAGKQ